MEELPASQWNTILSSGYAFSSNGQFVSLKHLFGATRVANVCVYKLMLYERILSIVSD